MIIYIYIHDYKPHKTMFSPAGHLQMSGLQAAEPQLSEFCRGIGISTATKRPRPS